MMDVPLSVTQIFTYGARVFGDTEVTSWSDNGPETITFSALAGRAAACAHALHSLCGIDADQRIGTMMNNCAEHMEVFFASSCMGAVFSPLNSHLSDDQIIHIINYADLKVIVVSPRNAPRLASLIPHCPGVTYIIIASGSASHRAAAVTECAHRAPSPSSVIDYEAFIDGQSTEFPWPTLPEDTAAALCFSTGTEGAPKGVAYSHRSMYLHSQSLLGVDSFAITNGGSFLCCVPIYHVLSWGVPLAAWMAGAPLIFPGDDVAAPRLAHIISTSMPRVAHGVPALWVSLVAHYFQDPPQRMSLREIFAGGAPVPPVLIRVWEEKFGVDVIQCWGMTETSPVGTVARPQAGLSGETRNLYRESQGRFPASISFRVADDAGHILEGHDRNQGEIQVRGNWITGSYFRPPAGEEKGSTSHFRGKPIEHADNRFTDDGWFRTGDVGSINRDGFLTVNDRIRDVIRSGGEWIYSAELENFVVDAPPVLECAVIGYPDDTWGERPLAVTVLADGIERTAATAERLRTRLRGVIPGWMIPEYWAFVDAIDKTSVDKYDKKDLRQHLADGQLNVISLQGPRRSGDSYSDSH